MAAATMPPGGGRPPLGDPGMMHRGLPPVGPPPAGRPPASQPPGSRNAADARQLFAAAMAAEENRAALQLLAQAGEKQLAAMSPPRAGPSSSGSFHASAVPMPDGSRGGTVPTGMPTGVPRSSGSLASELPARDRATLTRSAADSQPTSSFSASTSPESRTGSDISGADAARSNSGEALLPAVGPAPLPSHAPASSRAPVSDATRRIASEARSDRTEDKDGNDDDDDVDDEEDGDDRRKFRQIDEHATYASSSRRDVLQATNPTESGAAAVRGAEASLPAEAGRFSSVRASSVPSMASSQSSSTSSSTSSPPAGVVVGDHRDDPYEADDRIHELGHPSPSRTAARGTEHSVAESVVLSTASGPLGSSAGVDFGDAGTSRSRTGAGAPLPSSGGGTAGAAGRSSTGRAAATADGLTDGILMGPTVAAIGGPPSNTGPTPYPCLQPRENRPPLLLKIGTGPSALILSEGQALRRCVQKGWLWKKAAEDRFFRRWKQRYFRVVVHTEVRLLNEEAAMAGREAPHMDEVVTAAWLLYYADEENPEPKETIDLHSRVARPASDPEMLRKYPVAFTVSHERRRSYHLRPAPPADAVALDITEDTQRWIATINAAIQSINDLFVTRFRRSH